MTSPALTTDLESFKQHVDLVRYFAGKLFPCKKVVDLGSHYKTVHALALTIWAYFTVFDDFVSIMWRKKTTFSLSFWLCCINRFGTFLGLLHINIGICFRHSMQTYLTNK